MSRKIVITVIIVFVVSAGIILHGKVFVSEKCMPAKMYKDSPVSLGSRVSRRVDFSSIDDCKILESNLSTRLYCLNYASACKDNYVKVDETQLFADNSVISGVRSAFPVNKRNLVLFSAPQGPEEMSWSGLAARAQEGNSYWNELIGRVKKVVGVHKMGRHFTRPEEGLAADDEVRVEVGYSFDLSNNIKLSPNIQILHQDKNDEMVRDDNKIAIIGLKGRMKF